MSQRPLYPLSVWLVLGLTIPTLLALFALVLAATAGENVPFDRLDLWWLAGAVPLAGLFAVYGAWRRRSELHRFTSERLAPSLTVQWSPFRQALRAGAIALAVLMIVAGLVGPRWGRTTEKQEVYGVDVVVALDVSRSMLAEDLAPNRMEAAKAEINAQLTQRSAFQRMHRLALLAFAGNAALRLPLTTDHLAFRRQLEELHVGSAPRGGTAIAESINRAAELLESSAEGATKVVLVFTDGENHEGDPIETARRVQQEHGIRVYTIGVGDPTNPAGATIPIADDDKRKELVHNGQIVFSRLNTEALQAIAEAGGGTYVDLSDFHYLVDTIGAMERSRLATEQRELHRPQYQWFLGLALLLLAWEAVVGDRRRQADDTPRRVWQIEVPARGA